MTPLITVRLAVKSLHIVCTSFTKLVQNIAFTKVEVMMATSFQVMDPYLDKNFAMVRSNTVSISYRTRPVTKWSVNGVVIRHLFTVLIPLTA